MRRLHLQFVCLLLYLKAEVIESPCEMRDGVQMLPGKDRNYIAVILLRQYRRDWNQDPSDYEEEIKTGASRHSVPP
jgi:hypothetical protein